jgi:hypothetical protein
VPDRPLLAGVVDAEVAAGVLVVAGLLVVVVGGLLVVVVGAAVAVAGAAVLVVPLLPQPAATSASTEATALSSRPDDRDERRDPRIAISRRGTPGVGRRRMVAILSMRVKP